jgi:hypothetical protein
LVSHLELAVTLILFRISDFEFVSDFGFGISNFGFRIGGRWVCGHGFPIIALAAKAVIIPYGRLTSSR